MMSDTIGVIGFKSETKNFFNALSSYEESKLFNCNMTFFCRSAAVPMPMPMPLSFRVLLLLDTFAIDDDPDESPVSIFVPGYESA